MMLALATLLLSAADFAPLQDAVPNRQPQLASQGREVVMTFGAGNTVYFASSPDGGATWSEPRVVSSKGVLSLGMRRGPRIALASGGKSIVISAIAGEKGRGADGDLIAWRSTDGGKTWSAPKAINDVPGSAREGLHAMAAGGRNTLFATWLDLRSKGTKLYGSVSTDGGATWSPNRVVYESPSGTVCECCHPSAYVDEKGRIFVMYRNSLNGNRDMYVVRSTDGGASFTAAEKLGSGSWQLNACPMDGGSLQVAGDGTVTSIWRREGTIYTSGPGGTEEALGPGRQPVVARAGKSAYLFAWTEGKVLRLKRSDEKTTRTWEGEAAYPSIAALDDGSILLAGERGGHVFVSPVAR